MSTSVRGTTDMVELRLVETSKYGVSWKETIGESLFVEAPFRLFGN